MTGTSRCDVAKGKGTQVNGGNGDVAKIKQNSPRAIGRGENVKEELTDVVHRIINGHVFHHTSEYLCNIIYHEKGVAQVRKIPDE